MLLRLLLWAALIAAVIWFWRRWQRDDSRTEKTAEPSSQPMVRCAQCRVHLPQDQAVSDNDQWYCSQEHRLKGPKS